MVPLPPPPSLPPFSGGFGGDSVDDFHRREERLSHFIEIRAQLEWHFSTSRRNKNLWEMVANGMREKGYRRTGEQCKCKWKNLVTRYKAQGVYDQDNCDQSPFFDLRFMFLIIINLHKSEKWEWDPFHVATDLTWIKFWFLTILLFIFSFVFIGVPLISANNNIRYIHIHLRNFSTSLRICFLTSLLFPQVLFWYLYPLILLLFVCYTCISSVLLSFVFWLQGMLSILPDISIFVTVSDDVVEVDEEFEGIDVEEGALNG